MKAWYDITEEDQDAILKATTWNPADNGYFKGGGYSSRFLTEAEMPVTMCRINLVKGNRACSSISRRIYCKFTR